MDSEIKYLKTTEFEIEDLGCIEEDVYDLEIEDTHNFFANDILVHNSAGLNLEFLIQKVFGNDTQDVQKVVNFIDKFIKTYISPFIAQEFDRLANYLNAYENRLSMNREVIADKGLWRGKKNYILQVYDKEGIRYNIPKLKIMGIETAKSSTPKIVRGSLEKAIKILLNEDEQRLQDFVKRFKEEFLAAPIADIASPRGVSNIDSWVLPDGGFVKGTPIHVRGSIVYNRLLKKKGLGEYQPIKVGDKVKFIYLTVPNIAQSHVIAFLDSLPEEFGLNSVINRSLQFEKTFLEPLKSLSDIVGWNAEKVSNLDIFFQ